MKEQAGRALGKVAALAIIPCAVIIFIVSCYLKPFSNGPSVDTLMLARHEHNASLHELQGLVATLSKEVEKVASTRLQLTEAVTQLNFAQDALAAAQTSISANAYSSKVHSSAVSDAKNELRMWFDQYATGPGADKWSGYLDAYHRHFDRFRAQDRVTLVEVGVQSGGSIEMWRSYFGAERLNYIGVDVNAKCKQFEKEGVRIVIGDQGDPAFWAKFKADFPEALDIFIDDGGHLMTQQTVTLAQMFWHVRDGGIYLCEDMHTSYWPDWTGGYLNNDTMIERSKALVDTLNAWHSRDDRLKVDEWTRNIRGLHFYDSMVFIDKVETEPMERLKGGDNWIPYRRRLNV